MEPPPPPPGGGDPLIDVSADGKRGSAAASALSDTEVPAGKREKKPEQELAKKSKSYASDSEAGGPGKRSGPKKARVPVKSLPPSKWYYSPTLGARIPVKPRTTEEREYVAKVEESNRKLQDELKRRERAGAALAAGTATEPLPALPEESPIVVVIPPPPRPPDLKPFPAQPPPKQSTASPTLGEMKESNLRGEERLKKLNEAISQAKASKPKKPPTAPPTDSLARLRPVSLDDAALAVVPPPAAPPAAAPLPADPRQTDSETLREGGYALVPKSEADVLRHLLPGFDKRMASLRVGRMPEDRSLESLPTPPSDLPAAPQQLPSLRPLAPSAPARPIPLEPLPELPDSPRELAEMKYDMMERQRQEELAKRARAWEERHKLDSRASPVEPTRLPLEPPLAASSAPPPSSTIRAEPPGRRIDFRLDPEMADVVGPPPKSAPSPPTPATRPVSKLPVVEVTVPAKKTRVRVPLNDDEPDVPHRPLAAVAPLAPSLGRSARPPSADEPDRRHPPLTAVQPPAALPHLPQPAGVLILPSPPGHTVAVPKQQLPPPAKAPAAIVTALPLEPEQAPGLRLLELAARTVGALGNAVRGAVAKARGDALPPLERDIPPPPRPPDSIELAEGRPLSPQERRLVRMRNILLRSPGPRPELTVAEKVRQYAEQPEEEEEEKEKPQEEAEEKEKEEEALPALLPAKKRPGRPPSKKTLPESQTTPASKRARSVVPQWVPPASELIRTPPPISHDEFLRRAWERRSGNNTALPVIPPSAMLSSSPAYAAPTPPPPTISPPPTQQRSYASDWIEPSPPPVIDARRPRVVTTTTTYL